MDLYTKAVLTVIAGALAVLAAGHITAPANAQLPGMTCGDILNPCYIDFKYQPCGSSPNKACYIQLNR